MENLNNTNKDQTQDKAHPTPNSDPGAEIETVIPNPENETTSTESSDAGAKANTDADQKNTRRSTEDAHTVEEDEPINKPEIINEENGEPEITENEESANKPDDHGIETVSP